MPLNEQKVWRKLARLHLGKAGLFLKDDSSRWATAVWTVLTAPVMTIHYSLFKHATLLSDRHAADPAQQDAVPLNPEDDSLTAVCFCQAAANPAKKALARLSDLFFNMDHEDWGPAVLAFGPVMSWPQARLRTLRRSFCVVTGQLWRKLLFPWTQYPWRLAGLVDPEVSQEGKEECAQKLFSDPPCWLDGFARKLRQTVQSPEALLQEDVLQFLEAVFARVVPTSTFIERMFSRLTEWSKGRERGPKPRLSTIASKHCTQMFEQCVNRWRQKVLLQRQQKLHVRRPVWTQGLLAGRNQNGWNLFQKALFAQQPELLRLNPAAKHTAVKQAWQAADKGFWSQMASASNLAALGAMSKASTPASELSAGTPAFEHPGGPWGIGSSAGFPLARHVIDNTCNQVQANSQKFHTEHNALQPEAADSLDGAPSEPHPLFATCAVNGCGCHRCMPEASKPTMERLYKSFWKLVLRSAPRANVSAQAQEPCSCRFRPSKQGKVWLWQLPFTPCVPRFKQQFCCFTPSDSPSSLSMASRCLFIAVRHQTHRQACSLRAKAWLLPGLREQLAIGR